jgi:hypothetical protein
MTYSHALWATFKTGIALFGATGLLLGVVAAAPADATVKPAWCPSFVTSGVAVDFGQTRIIAGAPIENTTTYTYRNTNPRPTLITASFDASWTQSATFSASIEAQYGFSPLASVKARVDTSVTAAISRNQAYSQQILTPPGKRLKLWWSVDLRQVQVRYVQYRTGCQAIRSSSWATFTAPRSNTVKPQAAFVS